MGAAPFPGINWRVLFRGAGFLTNNKTTFGLELAVPRHLVLPFIIDCFPEIKNKLFLSFSYNSKMARGLYYKLFTALIVAES